MRLQLMICGSAMELLRHTLSQLFSCVHIPSTFQDFSETLPFACNQQNLEMMRSPMPC